MRKALRLTRPIAMSQPQRGESCAPSHLSPQLTSDVVELLLVWMIRLAGPTDAAPPWANDAFPLTPSYLASRYRRDPAQAGSRVHAILCTTRTCDSMQLVRRCALATIWWYNMDLASRDGRINVLVDLVTMHRVHGEPLDFSPTAIDLAAHRGHVHVLDWWLRASNVPLGASVHALDLASEAGHRHVLDWFTSMASKDKVTIQTTWSDRTGPYRSLSWSKPGLLALFSPNLRGLKHAIQRSAVAILAWWLPVILNEFGEQYPPDIIDWIGGAPLDVVQWWRLQDQQLPLARVFIHAAQHGRIETVQWILANHQGVVSDMDLHMAFLSAFHGSANIQVIQELFHRVPPELHRSFSFLTLMSTCTSSVHLIISWCFGALPLGMLPTCEELLIFATIHGQTELLDWTATRFGLGECALLPMVTSFSECYQVGGSVYRLGDALVLAIKSGHAAVLEWWWQYAERSKNGLAILEQHIGIHHSSAAQATSSFLPYFSAIKTAAKSCHLSVLDHLVQRYGKRDDIRMGVAVGATTARVLDWWQITFANMKQGLTLNCQRLIVEAAVHELNVQVLDWWCCKWQDGPLVKPEVYNMEDLFSISLVHWPMLQWYLGMRFPVFPDVGLPSTLVDEAITTGDWQGLEWWYHEQRCLQTPTKDDGLGFAFADRATSVPGLKWSIARLPKQRMDEAAIERAYLMAWRSMQTGLMWYWAKLAPVVCARCHQDEQGNVGTVERGVSEMWQYPPLHLIIHKDPFAQCPNYPCSCVPTN